MIALFSAFLGFLGSAFPDLLKLYRDKKDREHELQLLQLQMQQQAQGHSERLEEIGAYADIAEMRALENRVRTKTGIRWIDGLNATVRPFIAYSFFFLYAGIKITVISYIIDMGVDPFIVSPGDPDSDLPWLQLPTVAPNTAFWDAIWTVEDSSIFAAIISFYFGQRAMMKVRNGR